ncbi:MAG: lipoyl protein ligase domain-containing protein [Planctomycetota bacterium]
MRFLDLTSPDLTENLAIDEALLMERELRPDLGGILRFWEYPRHAVVLGSGGIVRDDVELESCQRDGITIARRSSGGGTVLLGPGCLLYSLVLDMEANPALSGISTSTIPCDRMYISFPISPAWIRYSFEPR